jgi:hypothetical protein
MHCWHRNETSVGAVQECSNEGDNDPNYEMLVRKFSDLLCAPLERKRRMQQVMQAPVNGPAFQNEKGPDLLLARLLKEGTCTCPPTEK